MHVFIICDRYVFFSLPMHTSGKGITLPIIFLTSVFLLFICPKGHYNIHCHEKHQKKQTCAILGNIGVYWVIWILGNAFLPISQM